MARGRQQHRRADTGWGVLIGLVTTSVMVALTHLTWPSVFELKLLDWRHRLFPADWEDTPAVVMAIDDASLEQLGRWAWPRRYLADIVRLCHQAGARQVVLDILMPEEQRVELLKPGLTDVSRYEPPPRFLDEPAAVPVNNDALLGEAIRNYGPVTLPFYVRFEAEPDGAAPEAAETPLQAQVTPMLRAAPERSFAEIYARLWPDRDLNVIDQDYYRLLRTVNRCAALLDLERFGFEPAGPVATPVYDVLSLTPPWRDFTGAIDNSGFVTVRADADGTVRRVALLARADGRFYKQLAFATACRAWRLRDDQIDLSQADAITLKDLGVRIPLDESGQLVVRWQSQWWLSRAYFPATLCGEIWEKEQALQENRLRLASIDDLDYALSTAPEDWSTLDEETRAFLEEYQLRRTALGPRAAQEQAISQLEEELVATRQRLADAVAGKIVLVGSVATAVPDFVVSPYSRVTPGVAVHHAVLNTLLNRSFLRRPPQWVELVAGAGLGLLMTLLAAGFSPRISGPALVLITLGYGLLNFWVLFGQAHVWFAAAGPAGAVWASFVAVTFYRQITEGRAKRHITARFKQYAAPAVVDRIVSSARPVALRGERRELSCYFSDLAGFTSVSELLGPERTVAVLNLYLDRMTEVLDRHEATINKFEGDGIFAFFGAPLTQPDHSLRACLAAEEAQRALARLMTEQQAAGDNFPALAMRIGINTGLAVVGDCGSARRFDYTAIGDTVNLAARLEGANKIMGTRVLICQTTREQAGDAVEVRWLGRLQVVGRQEPVGAYELLGRRDTVDDEQRTYAAAFAQAVGHYESENLAVARDAFEECRQERPSDRAVSAYLYEIDRVLARETDFVPWLRLSRK